MSDKCDVSQNGKMATCEMSERHATAKGLHNPLQGEGWQMDQRNPIPGASALNLTTFTAPMRPALDCEEHEGQGAVPSVPCELPGLLIIHKPPGCDVAENCAE